MLWDLVSLDGKYGKLSFTLLHSEWPKLSGVLAILSAIGFNYPSFFSFYRGTCTGIGVTEFCLLYIF